ncbi:MAG: PorP/SprF family type IX secretion system membrane protein [Bacteroidota bacterium]
MRILRFILFSLCCFLAAKTWAQDLHYSQYWTSPLNLNPATAGFFNGKWRAGLNSKSQWSSVTVPYQTITAFFDMQVVKRKYHRDALGLGIVLNRDQAGDSKFATTQAAVCISYIKTLNRFNTNLISIGIQPGIVQRSISYASLYFDDQFNGNSYDPGLAHNENFSRSNFMYFDLGAGAHWMYQRTTSTNFSAGLGVFHLTQPGQTLFYESTVRLEIKYSGYAAIQFSAKPSLDLIPSALYMKQGPYSELMVGTQIKFVRDRHLLSYTSINTGVFMRASDALVLMAGFDYKKFNFALSYDVNLSRLKPASKLRGGFELSLIYVHNRAKSLRHKDIPCPIF